MKVFISDFDGTIYFKGTFNSKDLNKLSDFRDNGNLYGICTGRNIHDFLRDGRALKPDFYLTCGGSVAYDKNKKVIYEQDINQEYVGLVLRLAKKLGYPAAVVNKDGTYRDFDIHDNIIKRDFEDMCKTKANCISIKAMEENGPLLVNLLNNFSEAITAFQNGDYVDVVNKDCSKGNLVKIVKDYFGFSKVASMGDSYNDISLVKVADVGFTFNSSPDSLKEVASYVVDNLYEAINIIEKLDDLELDKEA